MNKVYSATKLMCDTYAAQVQNTAEDVERWLTHKIKHTFQVTHEIMNIFYFTKEVYEAFDEEGKELVELSAILHDLGRLYQHNKKKILPSEEFEHGAAAVNILKKNELFNNPILLFAIGEHNHYQINYQNPYYLQLSDNGKKKADIIAKLLRDADKLDNIKHTVYCGANYVGKSETPLHLSDEIKTFLQQHRAICYINAQAKFEDFSAAEKFIGHLSWINDIYFEYTKSAICDVKYVEVGLAKLKEFGVSEDDLAFLKKYLVI
ncbi:MAG: HD domain-containing protein [Alphaproteobacteria bacterium]|nr:HD domain-containing protein [Alphaproteobacteria bacterium]